MSQMMSFSAIDGDDDPRLETPSTATVTVKRLGMRPLSFEGVELCMAMSYVPGAEMWFEINVYRTAHQRFVLCVKRFHRDEHETDVCRAWDCDDFETVMTTLEGYDPATDLRVDLGDRDEAAALPDLAALSMAIRARTGEARRQYAALVGEILHDLDHE